MCYDRCTIKIYKNASPKNGQQIIKCTRNNQNGMWEVLLETKQSEVEENNIMEHTTKTKLAQYLHESLFSPKTAIILKTIKQGFLNT